jgi:hypothetical protein
MRPFLIVVFALLGFGAPAQAQRSPVVVELFTSQGCAYCPPADEMFSRIVEMPGVIALALHVDYWDYLGWKDTFGSAANSDRQRHYAKAARSRSVYTPQFVVQGVDRMTASDPGAVLGAIEAHQRRPATVALEIGREGHRLWIRLASTEPAGSGRSDVFLARFRPSESVLIGHGDNAGRDITYSNVVTRWEAVARWDGSTPAELDLAVDGPEPLAVIVQRERLGPILTAAQLR